MMNTKILEQKISQYDNGELTRKELGLCAMRAYYSLMRGEYVELEKLMVYHFLKTISTFHVVPDDLADEYPCSEEEVKDIMEILRGKKDLCYTFNIRIYENLYKKEPYKSKWEIFKQLRKDIEETNKDRISPLVINELADYAKQSVDEICTLVDLLECHIKGIIMENINLKEGIVDFRQSVGIYVAGTMVNRENFIPNLKKLFSCIMGETYFRVSVVYKRGEPHLSLILL